MHVGGALELVCLAIVALYAGARLLRARSGASSYGASSYGGSRRAFLLRFGALAVAAAVGENTMIHAYGAYAYDPAWRVFVDRVPLVVVLVWPVVVDSAVALARCVVRGRGLGHERARMALLSAGVVFADAALIEPIAVRAGLWSWTDPGLFDVPLVGISGWAMFAGGAAAVLDWADGRPSRVLLVIVVAPLAAHALVLASWWALFRWTTGEVPAAVAVPAVWLLLVAATRWSWRIGERVPTSELLLRLPGALFFFVLLALVNGPASEGRWLFAYALAFAPPYLAAIAARERSAPARAT